MVNVCFSLCIFFIAFNLFFTKHTFLCLVCLIFLFFLAFGVISFNCFDLQFIMLANIIVYLGAVVILLIIVIMLINEQSSLTPPAKYSIKFYVVAAFFLSLLQLEIFQKFYQFYFLIEKNNPINLYTFSTWNNNETVLIWSIFETTGKYNFLLLGILLLLSLWVSLHLVTNIDYNDK